MKKISKALSIFMAVLMLFACVSVGAAAAEKKWDKNIQVYVEGFGTQKIYYADDPNQTSLLFPFDTDRIKSKIAPAVKDILKDAVTLNPNTAYNVWYNTIETMFGDVKLNKAGTASANPNVVSPQMGITKDETYGRYNFLYDSRLDPVALAAELYQYMELVYADDEAQTMIDGNGVLNIELIGSSYGTSVVSAFLYTYCTPGNMTLDLGDGKTIKFTSVTLCVPAVLGVDLVSQLFKGDFYVDYDALIDFLKGMDLNAGLEGLIDLLNATGVLKTTVTGLLEPALQKILDGSLHDSIRDIFGTFPAFWAFVTADDFQEAIDYVYDTPESREEYSELITLISEYNYNIKSNVPELLKSIEQAGTPVKLIVKYNKPMIPLLRGGRVMSDSLVTTPKAGMGTVCAEYGSTLSDEYLAENADHVISPDKILDASTGLFPDTTWYIKNLGHGKKPDSYYAFLHKISTASAGFNVYSSAEYPQFVLFDGDAKGTEGNIVPQVIPGNTDTPVTPAEKNFLQKIIDFFKTLWEKLTAFFQFA